MGYTRCFTKPLIAVVLLAVWVFSFGWMIAGATSLISVGHLGRRQGHIHLHN